jgi:hypothetical protein
MAFAQLTYRESLRDIETCLRALGVKLYQLGIRGKISRSTIADANNNRDWRIFHDFAHIVIQRARDLYANDDIGIKLDNAAYCLDASIIDLSLSLFPWALFSNKGGVAGIKLHTLLDLRGNIPGFFAITRRKTYELAILDELSIEAAAFYIMDRGYFDWGRLFRIHESQAFFVIRPKKDVALRRLYSLKVETLGGVKSDHVVVPCGNRGTAYDKYPAKLRRIRYYDGENQRFFIFLTNNFELSAQAIADLYKARWRVELFFKWIKQHLRIKAFYGTSENAVKAQICIAITVYVLVAILKKKLMLPYSLYSVLQVLSVTILEKNPIYMAFSPPIPRSDADYSEKQLNLYEIQRK